MKLHNAIVGFLCLSGLALTACQQTNQLKEMHDTTAEMNQTTKKMEESVRQTNDHLEDTSVDIKATNQNLEKMLTLTETLAQKMDTLPELSRKTDELSRITSGLCQGSRQALAEQSRNPLLDGLTYTAVTPADKIEHAAKYFKAFEYQAWGICGTQDLTEREVLMGSGSHEFFFAVQRYMTDKALPEIITDVKMTVDGKAQQGDTNKDANFNSLALTLHMTNHLQELMLAKNKKEVEESKGKTRAIAPVTMLSMIVDSLALNGAVNAGQIEVADLKEHQKIVLENRTAAIRLLQARHNMMAAVFLSKFEDQITLGTKVQVALEKIKKGLGGKAEVSVDRFSVVQLEELMTFLRASLQTRAALAKIGIQPVVDGKLKLVFTVLSPVSQTKSPAPRVEKARAELAAVIQAFKAQL